MLRFTSFHALRSAASSLVIASLATGALSGCVGRYNHAPQEPVAVKAPRPPQSRDTPIVGDGDDSIAIEKLGPDDLIPRPMHRSDPLPNVPLKGVVNITTTSLSVWGVLRDIADKNGFSIVRDGNVDKTGVTLSLRRGVTVPEAVENICRAARIWCSFEAGADGRSGTLRVSETETFMVPLPPVSETYESIGKSIKRMVGGGAADADVQVDPESRLLIYQSNYANQRYVEGYLRHIRDSRSMLVFETYIWEVTLSDNQQTGINWRKFSISPLKDASRTIDVSMGGGALSAAGTATAASLSPATGFGLVYTGAKTTIDVLASFLQQQGSVNNISQPRLSSVNGAKATFKSGDTIRYVKSISPPTSTYYPGAGGGTAPASPVTSSQSLVQVEELNIGTTMDIEGSYWGQTINAKIHLNVANFLGFDKFPTGVPGGELKLPQTNTREITANVRVLPGDVLLLAGLNQTQSEQHLEGLPGGKSHMIGVNSDSTKVTKTELVVAMRPKVVIFRAADADQTSIVNSNGSDLALAPPQPQPAPQIPVVLVPPAPAIKDMMPQETAGKSPVLPTATPADAAPVALAPPQAAKDAGGGMASEAMTALPASALRVSGISGDTAIVTIFDDSQMISDGDIIAVGGRMVLAKVAGGRLTLIDQGSQQILVSTGVANDHP